VGQSGDAAELPVDEALLDRAEVVCDLAYRGDGAETGLIGAARRRGLRAVGGLDVLVGQGALSFRIFTGVEAPLDVMRAAVRDVPPAEN
jgi:shikimate dehydrogenase